MANIQKVVPVRKNGYILELLVPPPGSGMQVNYAPPKPASQTPQESVPEEAALEASKNFSLRNLFMR